MAHGVGCGADAMKRWLIACAAAAFAGIAVITAAYAYYATEQWLGMRENAIVDIERYERDLDYPNRESALRSARHQLAAVKSEFWVRVGIPAVVLGIECFVLVPVWRAAERRVGRWRLAALAVCVTVAIAGTLTMLLLYAMRGVITG